VPLLPPSDEFVGLLARAVRFIPDVGSDLSKLVSEAAGWGYTPVGAELFIESAANQYQINTNELAMEQVFDFTWNLAQNLGDLETALGKCPHAWLRHQIQDVVRHAGCEVEL
jgi:hypothetical protein